MKKIKESMGLLIIFVGLIVLLVINYLKEDEKMHEINLNLLPTSISNLEDNAVWCPTLQLIWNDLKNQVIGQDILFIDDKNNQDVLDLNKESFNERMISNEYFYKNYGYMTPILKEEIESGIWNKFKEKSDILDRFNFNDNNRDYFFYSMLVRNFKFKNSFDIISDNTFGITENSSDKLDENVKVLFYKDDAYAVKLLTKNGDEVILYKGARKNNFNDLYQMIVDNTKETPFNSDDTITIANLNFKSESKYSNLTNNDFYDINGVSHRIEEVIQTIMFTLDNTGGKVKSEAGMNVKFTSVIENRHFDFSDDFVLFLKENNRDNPYFAINIVDINKFN